MGNRNRGSTGTHGGDAGFAIGGLSEHIDAFLDEYLRVNAEASERREGGDEGCFASLDSPGSPHG